MTPQTAPLGALLFICASGVISARPVAVTISPQNGELHGQAARDDLDRPSDVTDQAAAELDMGGMPMGGSTTEMDMGGGGDMPMAMPMTFFRSEEATILFTRWTTTQWQGMLGSCLVVAVISALYEGLKVGRQLLLQARPKRPSAPTKVINGSNGFDGIRRMYIPHPASLELDYDVSKSSNVQTKSGCKGCSAMCGPWHWFQSILQVIQFFIGYSLMLIFMSYNIYLCVSLAMGSGLGYLLFAWMTRSTIGDHCE